MRLTAPLTIIGSLAVKLIAGPAAAPALVPGGSAVYELAAGATARHPLALQAGQLLQLELHEKGPRIVLELFDPSGSPLARREAMDMVTDLGLLAVAGGAGTYSVAVTASAEGRSGTYELRVDELRPATDADRARVAADESMAEALRLSRRGTSESRRDALKRLDAAEAPFRDGGDRRRQAQALYLRGWTLYDLGDPQGSQPFEQARGLFHELADPESEAAALNGLGEMQLRASDLDAAQALFERAAALAGPGHVRGLSYYVNNAGIVFNRRGQPERAIEYFTRAAALAEETGDRMARARPLNNMGVAYRNLGELDKARECYQRALAEYRAVGNRDQEMITLGNLGGIHALRGDDRGALLLMEEALRLAEASGAAANEARLLNNMARLYRRGGAPDRAIELGERSLRLRRQVGDRVGEAATLQTLGRSHHARGEHDAALACLREALRIVRAVGERPLEPEMLLAIAAVERDRGRLAEALEQAEAAVTQVDTMRAAITSPDLRTSYVAIEQDRYAFYVDLLMRLHEAAPAAGHDAAALQASERARARVLLDALAEARADVRGGIAAGLLERERDLQKKLSEAGARQSRLLARGGAASDVERARAALESVTEEYSRLQARIRAESPRYAALTQPVPATVGEIRREVLDGDTVLLEFFLGDERSFLWALTPADLFTLTLPGRARIEAAARSVHQLLTERQRARGMANLGGADRRLNDEAVALSTLLLGGIGQRLATDWKGKRLLIVTSGALAYLPLGLLPSPAEPARPLLRDHEIVVVPSASVLMALRREGAARPATSRRVAVLADPVFDRADPRVRAVGAAGATLRGTDAPTASAVSLRRAADGFGGAGFGRLPFSRKEAAAIASLVPAPSLLQATDFRAARSLIADGGLSDREVVHIATHGLLNSEHPELSGLVLSLVDESGAPVDGFLRMNDIYNLRLNADLVVLSACQTALGREIRGEGLIGLTRGFLYAGARAVVASLWKVDDESTAELMKRFYRGMFKERRRPADALRLAQLEMSRDRRWSAPFHWAGFVLQGDWR